MTTMCWIFAVITLAAGLIAAIVENMRRATLALWIAGLGMGGIYLTLGAETLAIIQWIISTLGAISFIFFAVMFGEYGAEEKKGERRRLLKSALALVLGAAFSAVIYLGAGKLPEGFLGIPTGGNDLAALGQTMTQDHLLSLEVLALTLFLVLVGGGVVARPERNPANGEALDG